MCIYGENTTIFVSSKLAVYYIRHNYMFRPLMLVTFTLYMDLQSSYTAYVGFFQGVVEGIFFVGMRSRLCQCWVSGMEQYYCHPCLSLAMPRMGFLVLSQYPQLYNGICLLGLGCYDIVFTVLQYLYSNHSVHPLSLSFTFFFTLEVVVWPVSKLQVRCH